MTKKSKSSDGLYGHFGRNWKKYEGGTTLLETLNHMGLFNFKDGGRVRGCGAAKRGFGKAMRKK